MAPPQSPLAHLVPSSHHAHPTVARDGCHVLVVPI